MEQNEMLEHETREADTDSERDRDDYEDYKCNGGELEYEDWLSEKIEQAELMVEYE
jgi:hypothetical protein